MDWKEIQIATRNSLLQITSIKAQYNAFRPYQSPVDLETIGTGFIVDAPRGLVMTNAHVVSNSISIAGRITLLGEYDMSLTLVGICREKDIAICVIGPDDIELLKTKVKNLDILTLRFDDNFYLHETDEVMAAGYPLASKTPKYTTGTVSGFHSNREGDDDENGDWVTEEEVPSFIQVTAPLNHGNSGGPLFNRKGKVVGMTSAGYAFAQSVGYAIGSRTLLSVYSQLVSPLLSTSAIRGSKRQGTEAPHIVITPKFAFRYNKTTKDLLRCICPTPPEDDFQGIYIGTVFPNSAFSELREGDILTHIVFPNIYQGEGDPLGTAINPDFSASERIRGSVDNYGEVSLDLPCSESINCRKITLKELFDTLPVGSPVELAICRPRNSRGRRGLLMCEMLVVSSNFSYVPSTVRRKIYPHFEPFRYRILAGLSIGELTLNHIELDKDIGNMKDLKRYSEGKKRYQPLLVINQIFPETTAYKLQIFEEGQILAEINDQPVSTVEDIERVLSKASPFISFVTKDRIKFVIERRRAEEDDEIATRLFNL